MRNNLRGENSVPVGLPWDEVLPSPEAELACVWHLSDCIDSPQPEPRGLPRGRDKALDTHLLFL